MDVLTDWESSQLEGYCSIAESNGGEGLGGNGTWMFSISQSVGTHATTNSGGARLQCLTKNNFPTFSYKHGRWLLALEALASSTIVVKDDLSIHGERSSFCSKREDCALPARSRTAMYIQAGDSMAVPCVGLALMWYHSQNRKREKIAATSFLGGLSARLLKRTASSASSADGVGSPDRKVTRIR